MATLFLIPTPIAEGESATIPQATRNAILHLKHFIVEDFKQGRSAVKLLIPEITLQSCNFYELNEHTERSQLDLLLEPLKSGTDVGLLSDAGCPAVADPGTVVVRLAHAIGATVKPLTGPCSILLSIMASGLSGQKFSFVGYPPKSPAERKAFFQEQEKSSQKNGQAIFFIDTAYRTQRVIEELTQSLAPGTLISICQNLTSPEELIYCAPVSDWRKREFADRAGPAVFGVMVLVEGVERYF